MFPQAVGHEESSDSAKIKHHLLQTLDSDREISRLVVRQILGLKKEESSRDEEEDTRTEH
jgi:hypothetical protein